MEARFNSCELVRQKDDSHLQTIVGRPGAAGFGHVSVHQLAAIRKDLLSSIRN
jgi:hypothetical protein